MTTGGWAAFVLFAASILCVGTAGACLIENVSGEITSVVVTILLILGLFLGTRWHFQNTASGQWALTDQKSDLDNGLERTAMIYAVDGEIIAQYTEKINIEGSGGGYVLFNYEGKRHTYYNCFVESIAEIGPRYLWERRKNMKRIYAGMFLYAVLSLGLLTGCDQGVAHSLGGDMTLESEPDQKPKMITWKDDFLWYLTWSMQGGEELETHTFQQSSEFGVFEGTVTIIEPAEEQFTLISEKKERSSYEGEVYQKIIWEIIA